MSVSESEQAAAPTAVPDVRLVTGHLTDHELAALTVVVSALSVTSRQEAQQRRLLEGAATVADGWGDPVHRLPGMHAARALPTDCAWQFSHR